MASALTASEVQATFRARDEMSGVLSKIHGHTKDLGGSLHSVAETAVGFAAGMVGLQSAGAVFGFLKEGIVGVNEAIEAADTRFHAMGMSAKDADTHVRDLMQFALKTPFPSASIVAASEKLRLMGGAGLDTQKMLQTLADASAGSGISIEDLSTSVGRMYSALQNGLPIDRYMKALMKSGAITGETAAKILEMEKAGASGADIWNVLTANLDRFAGTSAEAASEFPAVMRRIHDSITLLIAGGFKPLFDMVKVGLGNLATWLQSAAVQAWAAQAGLALKQFSERIVGLIGFLTTHRDVLRAVAIGIGAIAAVIMAALVPALIAAAIPMLPLIAGLLLVGGAVALLAYAFDHNFLGMKDAVMNTWAQVQPVLEQFRVWLGEHLPGILQALGTVAKIALAVLITAFMEWWQVTGTVIHAIITFVQGIGPAFDAMGTKVHDTLTAVGDWFGALPGRITTALGNLGTLLFNSGKALLQGLLDGMLDTWNNIADWVGSIAGWIKDHKGPLSTDSQLLYGNGLALMSGLRKGIESGWMDVQKSVSGMTASLPTIGGGGLTGGSAGLSSPMAWAGSGGTLAETNRLLRAIAEVVTAPPEPPSPGVAAALYKAVQGANFNRNRGSLGA